MRFTAPAVLLLLACQLATCQASYPSKPTVKYGKYYGTCNQLAASNSAGTSAYCVDKGYIVSLPYYVTIEENKGYPAKYSWYNDAVSVKTAKGGKSYDYAAYISLPGELTLSSIKGKGYCGTVTTSESATKFRFYTEKVNKQWIYVEEGTISTPDNTPTEQGCNYAEAPKLFCNSYAYNYRCVAYQQ